MAWWRLTVIQAVVALTLGPSVRGALAQTCEATWTPGLFALAGIGRPVHELMVFDDGRGPALYAGGVFSVAAGDAANGIAKWNGTQWSPLAGGVHGEVRALTVFDDGSGPALFAGGWFDNAGGVSANGIAKWNGIQWSALGSGVNGLVFVLTVFENVVCPGPALYAGGAFTTAGSVASHYFARWGCECAPIIPAISRWGMISIMLLLLTAGTLIITEWKRLSNFEPEVHRK